MQIIRGKTLRGKKRKRPGSARKKKKANRLKSMPPLMNELPKQI